jgi:hypothetical protein
MLCITPSTRPFEECKILMQRLANVPQALCQLDRYSPIAGTTANKVVTIGRVTVNVCAITGSSSVGAECNKSGPSTTAAWIYRIDHDIMN